MPQLPRPSVGITEEHPQVLRGRKFQLPTVVTGLRTYPILTSFALWYHLLTHSPPGVSWHHLPNKSFALESLPQGLLLGEQTKTLSFLRLCVYRYYANTYVSAHLFTYEHIPDTPSYAHTCMLTHSCMFHEMASNIFTNTY